MNYKKNMKQILNNFFIFGDSYSDEHAPPYPNHPNQYENDEFISIN